MRILGLLSFLFLMIVSCNTGPEKSSDEDKNQESPTMENNENNAELKFDSLHVKIQIDAPPELVYQTMLDPQHFREWVAPWSPTSQFKGTWEKGSFMRFESEDENGNPVGMVSRIKENIPNELVTIEHLGMISEGKDIMEGEDVESFKGATESYRFTKVGNLTEVTIETDIFITPKEFFAEMWPKSLEILKSICEEKTKSQ